MTHITVSIDIARPPEEVFAFISDPENNPKWQQGMVACNITSEGAFGVGSTYSQKAKFLGRDIISNFEIVAFEPGRRIKGVTVDSTFPITFDRSVTPTKGGTLATAVITGEPNGIFRLFGPLMDWMVKRSVSKDYANLKQLLEEM